MTKESFYLRTTFEKLRLFKKKDQTVFSIDPVICKERILNKEVNKQKTGQERDDLCYFVFLLIINN